MKRAAGQLYAALQWPRRRAVNSALVAPLKAQAALVLHLFRKHHIMKTKLKQLALRLTAAALVGSMLGGCCVLPYGPRGHYRYDGHVDGGRHGGGRY
ncbi:hypothetical protein [Roseateles violae]|uniref:Lipoprotein n=1 Tax=Roseateles violae TaxID=3058042 RepID=A0ABT8DU10_9BURK|nr:hypothetical protein [Pelomonas sp. PFR6]MDN3919862.1 hypothetical protein [Pelomonas sp. PFR6]